MRKTTDGQMLKLGLGILLILGISMAAQVPAILSVDELKSVVPPGFYFEGQTAPTQMRNAAAIRFGNNHHLIAALVDTSGYASGIRSKYEGFLICDTNVELGNKSLPLGSYGFGIGEDGKFNLYDIGGNPVTQIQSTRDAQLKTPRPLSIVKSGNEFRLYRGRNYLVLKLK